jgi:hypothetical protein
VPAARPLVLTAAVIFLLVVIVVLVGETVNQVALSDAVSALVEVLVFLTVSI